MPRTKERSSGWRGKYEAKPPTDYVERLEAERDALREALEQIASAYEGGSVWLSSTETAEIARAALDGLK